MIPALIGAGVAAAGLISNHMNSKADRASRAEGRQWLNEQQAASNSQYDQMLRDIDAYYNKRGSMGTVQDVNSYKDAIAGYSPDEFVYTPEGFSYNKTRDDFITPYYDQIIGDMTQQVQHSAAGAGLGRGSGAAQAIAQAVAEKDNDLFKEAQQEYRDDRNFEYQKYADYAQTMQRALDAKRAATDTKIALQGNLAQDYYGAMDAAQADRLRAQQDKIATGATYSTAMAGLY